MASKKKQNPGARRAQKNARRATRNRRTPGAPRIRSLYNLNPPGCYYQEWDRPTGTDENVMDKVVEEFGADSGEAATMRLLLEYRAIYGPQIPIAAACHLDLILRDTDLVADLHESLGSEPEDVRESIHSLHAQGMLLIADDGSLWMTVPPGTPYSAPNGQWAFVEKKADVPKPAPVG
ncbi:hypothetical protein [Streptomyces drozdowiczii]|uniref:Uncharacterized protein n=1 Tax=Streptomyces drozdowiczii TaxID=202862 RepID=A0ABY6Q198_9ACTN|nr:hypothetical protein [Streptomyces drozdowiczii]MCX0241831.1 hypothetical protein [Streptomyces drozdowiczii]UZK58325.1 hypothetical protein NEH16_33385 [Streptomyces drozdowiczii]